MLNTPLTFDDQEPSQQFSMEDSTAKPSPPDNVADARATKVDYSLGDQSPGKDVVKQQILNGGEGELRNNLATYEDAKNDQAKNALVSTVAQTQGSNLTPEAADVMSRISQYKSQTDPSSIIERIYSGKFVNDVLTSSDKSQDPNRIVSQAAEANVATDVKTRNQWLQTQDEDMRQEWANTSWVTAIKDYAVSSIPFIPWWRQAQAMADRPLHVENVLPGRTILDNVQYLHALPFDQMKQQYGKAMQYFRDHGNALDALTFTQAMVSYGTSDEYLSNSMGVADFSTAGSVLGHIASPWVFGAKAAVRSEVKSTVRDDAIAALAEQKQITGPPAMKQIGYEGSNKFTVQPDLFGEPPDQGAFRFMNAPEQGTPTLESKLPPGKMRATFQPEEPFTRTPARYRDKQGRIQTNTNALTQQELPLTQPSHQMGLDLGEPVPRPAPPIQEAVALEPAQEVRRSLAAAIQATEGEKIPAADAVLAASGQVKPASFIGAVKRILNPFGRGNDEVLNEVPTFAAPDGFFRDSKVISRARQQALKPFLEDAVNKLSEAAAPSALARVSRMTSQELAIANQQANASLMKEYGKRLGDAIQNIIYTPAEAHPANVDTVTMHVGMPDGSLFPTKQKAALWREQYKLGAEEADIVPQGDKYRLEIYRHPDETDDIVRSTAIQTKDLTNTNPINMLLGRLRSAADLFGNFQRDNRYIATHAPQALRQQLKSFIDDNIQSLPKQSRQMLREILEQNRDMPNPTNPLERGQWYKSASDLEQAWLDRFKRLPNEKEILAYDQFRRLSDFDWLLRNSTVYRDKARQGVQNFRYSFLDGTDKKTTPFFEGKQLDGVPWSTGNNKYDAGIWVHDQSGGKFYYQFNMTPEERQTVNQLVTDKGYKVVQIFDPKTHPLEGVAKTAAGEDLKDQVNYVVTNSWDKAPLSWKQVDYRPGGHVIYPHQWYVSQAVVQSGRKGKFTYLGDNNILNVATQAEARKWSERLDYARQLMKTGQTDVLNDYIDNQLPHTRDQFYDLFRRSDSPLDMDHPVTFKEAGSNTLNSVSGLKQYGGGNLIDATRNPHDLSNTMDKSFLMDRDNILSTVLENGKSMRLGPAGQLDPYVALNKAWSQNMRNIWMNDYKISAVEKWIREFGPAGSGVLRPTNDNLLSNPMFFLYNPQYESVASSKTAELAAAKASQRAIVNFIGNETELGSAVNSIKMRLMDGVYNTAGQGKMLNTALETTADPIHFLRALAFHPHLGMFNPGKFFLHASGMFHSIAISGVTHGVPGFSAAPLLRWAMAYPDKLDTIASVASKVGWSESSFKQLYETMQRSGIQFVGGEAAMRDDAFDPHLFQSTAGKFFLETGPWFFNEGIRQARLSGFATAFHEFQSATPTVSALSNRQLGAVLRRAEDLSYNLTRADNAPWQTGMTSIPTQFWTWHARIMDQMVGGRTSGVEKLRALATYSALFGAPIGAGIFVGGVWPMYDSIKEEAFKRGIDLNDGWWKTASEGLLSQGLSWATGKDYDLSQRIGPGGNPAIREMLDGDKSFLDTVGGASGTMLGDIFKATYPFVYYAKSVVSDTGEFKLEPNDWLNFFRNIGTLDEAAKAYGIMQYGKWITKTGTRVGPAEGIDAAMALLALSPRSVSDTFLMQHALKGQKEAQTAYAKLAGENFRMGLSAAANNDWAQQRDYFKRAHTIMEAGDFNFAQQSEVMKRLIKENMDLAQKVRWDMLKAAPNSRYNTIFQNFIRKQ